jgi:hypothetical protein
MMYYMTMGEIMGLDVATWKILSVEDFCGGMLGLYKSRKHHNSVLSD